MPAILRTIHDADLRTRICRGHGRPSSNDLYSGALSNNATTRGSSIFSKNGIVACPLSEKHTSVAPRGPGTHSPLQWRGSVIVNVPATGQFIVTLDDQQRPVPVVQVRSGGLTCVHDREGEEWITAVRIRQIDYASGPSWTVVERNIACAAPVR